MILNSFPSKKQPTLSSAGSYDFVPKWSKNGQLPSSIFDHHTYSNKEWMDGGVFMSGVVEAGYGAGGGFALIVVLFILLIIVGAAYVGGGFGGAY